MISETFNALKFEEKHESDYRSSRELQVELSSCHSYTDGITYNYVYYGDIELGRYWRDPWRDGWLFQATGAGDGIQKEADTDYEAICRIKLSWEGGCEFSV